MLEDDESEDDEALEDVSEEIDETLDDVDRVCEDVNELDGRGIQLLWPLTPTSRTRSLRSCS